uniref:V1 protein n=1 Tax=Grapevine red blotch virus TaxID=1381007 RepID=A0A4P8W7J3_9GEMI|nr:V1 protein [Grapevine red blotch virus]
MVMKKRSRQRKQRRRRRTTGRSSAVRRRARPRSRPCQFAFHGNSFGGTPSLFFLTPIALGTGAEDRTGPVLTVSSMYLKGVVLPTDNVTDGLHDIYFWIILDRFPTGTDPSVSDIFTGSDNSGSMIETFTRNRLNRKRFRILGSKKLVVGVNKKPQESLPHSRAAFNIFQRRRLVVAFKNDVSGGGRNDVERNRIYLSAASASGHTFKLYLNGIVNFYNGVIFQ